jgi:hypothetical protein
MTNQTSGVVPSHADKRMAIEAVMLVLPFSSLERETREICNSFAACVTVINTLRLSLYDETQPWCYMTMANFTIRLIRVNSFINLRFLPVVLPN